MDHVRDVPVESWEDQRDAEWQVAIFKWHTMLYVWGPKVTLVGQMMALEGLEHKLNYWSTIFAIGLLQQSCSVAAACPA